MPGGILQRRRRRAEPQLRAARRGQVPQRRAGDRGGREILLRALSRQRRGLHQGACRGSRDARSQACRVPSAPTLARFSALLFQRHRRGLDRPEEVCRERGRGRLQEGAGRRGSLQVRLFHARRRTGDGGVRRLLAQGAHGEAAGLEGDSRRGLAALKRGEVDLAYSIRGELAEELRRTPGLTLKPVLINSPFWIYFADQWDPKSPWSDARVRKAVTLALDREGINQALTLGYSLLTGSIVPKDYEFYWQPPKIPYDPAAARQLLAEAGFRGGFNGGEYYCDASYANLAEAALNSLAEVGIRLKLRPIERAAFTKEYGEKKYRNIIQGGSGAFGNAATRMETFVVKGGTYVYGSYPDIDDLFAEQAAETDGAKRTAILQRMQQLVHERTVYAPLWQLAFLNGQGPRIEDSALGLISGHPYSAPYEDVRLKGGA